MASFKDKHAGGNARIIFLEIFAAVFCGFLAIGAVLPVLPRYMNGPLGASDIAVGTVMGAQAITAIIARPLAGRAADRSGRRIVVIAGSGITAMAGVLYFIPAGLPGLFASRLVLGLGEGLIFTAGGAWVVALASAQRRGKALGLFGLSMWSGLTAGPLIGELLRSSFGYSAVWLFSIAAPTLGALVAWQILESHIVSPKTRNSSPLLPRAAIRPGLAFALANVGYGALAAFIVLLFTARGLRGGAGTFTAFGAAFVTTRLFAAGLPDRLGARRVAFFAACSEAVGLALIAGAVNQELAMVGAVVMGCGFSILYPALALLAVNGVETAHQGAAIGAFTAFWDLGLALGGPLLGALAAFRGYAATFWFGSFCAVAAALLALASNENPPRIQQHLGLPQQSPPPS
jgi:MFS family permease